MSQKNQILSFNDWLVENKKINPAKLSKRLFEADGGEVKAKGSDYSPEFKKELQEKLVSGTSWGSNTPYASRVLGVISGIINDYWYSYNVTSLDDPKLERQITEQQNKENNPGVVCKVSGVPVNGDIKDVKNYKFTGVATPFLQKAIVEKYGSLLLAEKEDVESGETRLQKTKLNEIALVVAKINDAEYLVTKNIPATTPATTPVDLDKIACTVYNVKTGEPVAELTNTSVSKALASPKGGNKGALEVTSTEKFKESVASYFQSLEKQPEKETIVPALLAVKLKMPNCETVKDAIIYAKGKGATLKSKE